LGLLIFGNISFPLSTLHSKTPRIDANSLREPFFTDPAKKFLYDADAMHMFNHTKKLESIVLPGDYDALYMPGGHGCCTDCVNNPTVKGAIETMYNAGKIVTSVCHGPVALAECNKADGTPLVQGLTVTGFADSEEEAVQHVDKVPFLIETRFKELGANYEKADDWHPKVCKDGNLITGQNPGSSDLAAKTVVEALGA
jgi:putative intracellular protease/amidase